MSTYKMNAAIQYRQGFCKNSIGRLVPVVRYIGPKVIFHRSGIAVPIDSGDWPSPRQLADGNFGRTTRTYGTPIKSRYPLDDLRLSEMIAAGFDDHAEASSQDSRNILRNLYKSPTS
ncbi:MAG: hypothetical protein ACE5DM_02650 [Candidatus Nanoarchaeia archaeon]